VFTTLALSALFFVVTGIQFWGTQFFTQVIKASYGKVLICFAVTSATAPVLGVVFGGMFVDKIGGYKGLKGMYRTSLFGTLMAVLAVILAVPAAFTTNFTISLVSIWLVLFFGGAIVPGATGLVLTSVPPSLRPFSAALSTLTYNVLGYAAGTLIPGLYMQFWMRVKHTGYVTVLDEGFRMVLMWSGFGLIFMLLTTHEAYKKWGEYEKSKVLAEQINGSGGSLKKNDGVRGEAGPGDDVGGLLAAAAAKSSSASSSEQIAASSWAGVAAPASHDDGDDGDDVSAGDGPGEVEMVGVNGKTGSAGDGNANSSSPFAGNESRYAFDDEDEEGQPISLPVDGFYALGDGDVVNSMRVRSRAGGAVGMSIVNFPQTLIPGVFAPRKQEEEGGARAAVAAANTKAVGTD
jgi:MFS family permease